MLTTTVSFVQAQVPVTVLQLDGQLDGASYQAVIDEARDLYAGGTRDLLLDLDQLSFMSSSGLVTLHSVALIMRGETLPDLNVGWNVFHAIAHDVEAQATKEAHFKLLSPQPRIQKALETTGFDRILTIYQDREEALTSF